MKKLFIYVSRVTVTISLLLIALLNNPASAKSLTKTTFPEHREPSSQSSQPDFIHDECVFDSCYARYLDLGLRLEHISYGDPLSNGHNIYYGVGESVVFDRSVGAPNSVGAPRRRALKFQKVQQQLFSSGRYDEASEKAKLVRQLTAFRDTATALPYLYATIDREYGGDIPAYVDALFENSAITNPKRMKRLVRKVTKRRLKNDMGFQFVVSKYVYRLWLEQGRPKAAQGDGIYVFPLRKE